MPGNRTGGCHPRSPIPRDRGRPDYWAVSASLITSQIVVCGRSRCRAGKAGRRRPRRSWTNRCTRMHSCGKPPDPERTHTIPGRAGPKELGGKTRTLACPPEKTENREASVGAKTPPSQGRRSRSQARKPRQHWGNGQKKSQPMRVGILGIGGAAATEKIAQITDFDCVLHHSIFDLPRKLPRLSRSGGGDWRCYRLLVNHELG
jgi:hypothetical protein